MISTYRFLLVLLLPLIVSCQVLTSSSYCLGNCTTCDPLSLTKCLLPYPCDWNFYSEKGEGQCILGRSTELISHELHQSSVKIIQNLSKGWSQIKQKSHCEYISKEGKKYIQILGLFKDVQKLQKTFEVDPFSDSFELTFVLVLNEWLPFNDFLMVDVLSSQQNLHSLELSFEARLSVDSQVAVITCNGERVLTKKYSLKFPNKNRGSSQLVVVFTSHVQFSMWGLTNLRLQQGCLGYTIFNEITQKCNTCDSDSYAVSKSTAEWCEKCPLFCKTCESKTKCLTCIQGASLNGSGICDYGSNYKFQMLYLGKNLAVCDGQFKMGSASSKIKLNASSYAETGFEQTTQLGMVVYYFPHHWTNTSQSYISIKVNKVQVMKIDYLNLTNQGVTRCMAFQHKRAAKIELFSDSLEIKGTSAVVEFQLVSQEKGVEFGVSSVRITQLINTASSDSSSVSPTSKAVKNSEDIQDVKKETSLPSYLKSNDSAKNSTASNDKQPSTVPSSYQTERNSSFQQKFQLGKFLEDLIISSNKSSNISFVSQSNSQSSGLQIYIQEQIESKNLVFEAYVDKLDKSEYSIGSVSFRQDKLSIFLKIDKSFTEGNVAIYKFTSSRLLADSSPQLVGSFKVARFDSLTKNEISTLQSFSSIFSAFAWVGVLLMFLSVLLGVGVTMQQFLSALQVLFLHVYICSQYLPITFRDVIGGLRNLQLLNFFSPTLKQTIEDDWMSNAAENVPIRLQLYNQGVYFLKAFYPLIIVNVIYALWYLGARYAQLKINKDLADEEKHLQHRLIDNIAGRLVNYSDQIWRYQFMTTIWFCFLQFFDLSSPSSAVGINAVMCILAFVCSLAWPCFVIFYSRRQYYERQYSEYIYTLEDVYYGKIPQYELPSIHHRLGFPFFRTVKQFSFLLIICYFGNDPNFTLFSLMAFQVAEILYAKGQQIYVDKKYLIFKMVENGLFVLIEFVLIIMFECDKMVSSNVFKAMGYFLSGIALLILINSTVRVAYLLRKKYHQLTLHSQDQGYELKKPQTQRVV